MNFSQLVYQVHKKQMSVKMSMYIDIYNTYLFPKMAYYYLSAMYQNINSIRRF